MRPGGIIGHDLRRVNREQPFIAAPFLQNYYISARVVLI